MSKKPQFVDLRLAVPQTPSLEASAQATVPVGIDKEPDPQLEAEAWSSFLFECLENSERGDAELYRRLCHGRYVFDASENAWYKFVGPHWEKDTKDESLEAACEVRDAYADLLLDPSLPKRTREMLETRISRLNSLVYPEKIRKLSAVGKNALVTDGAVWDRQPHLMACLNGVVDLRTGELLEGCPDMYLRRRVPTAYNPRAACPSFMDFLESIFRFVELPPSPPELEPLHDETAGHDEAQDQAFSLGAKAKQDLEDIHRKNAQRERRNDELLAAYQQALEEHARLRLRYMLELVAFMQRLLGYALLGICKEHIIAVLHGAVGSNGKGTLIETVSRVLGDFAGSVQPELLLHSPVTRSASSASPEILDLMGKRLVFASETDRGRFFDASTVKRLTGGDTLVGRYLYGREMVRFEPTHTILLVTNFKPIPPADDPAFWRRVIVISFNVKFVETPDPAKPEEVKMDRDCKDKLKAEDEGILAWIVQGALEYRRIGLCVPDFLRNSAQTYQQETDLFRQFLEECCDVDPDLSAPAGELYKAYRQWSEENGIRPVSNPIFRDTMLRRGFKQPPRRNSGMRYVGLALLPEWPRKPERW